MPFLRLDRGYHEIPGAKQQIGRSWGAFWGAPDLKKTHQGAMFE